MSPILLSVKKRVDGSFDSKWSETLMAKIGKQYIIQNMYKYYFNEPHLQVSNL